MKKTLIKILAGLVGLFVLINGLLFMFKPELVIGHSSISANNVFGMSTVRGLIGGSMVVTALFVALALLKSRLDMLHSAAFVLLGWTFGRIVSLIMDGFDKAVLGGGIVISLIMAVILMVAHKILSQETAEK